MGCLRGFCTVSQASLLKTCSTAFYASYLNICHQILLHSLCYTSEHWIEHPAYYNYTGIQRCKTGSSIPSCAVLMELWTVHAACFAKTPILYGTPFSSKTSSIFPQQFKNIDAETANIHKTTRNDKTKELKCLEPAEAEIHLGMRLPSTALMEVLFEFIFVTFFCDGVVLSLEW